MKLLEWILNATVDVSKPLFPILERYETNSYIYYGAGAFLFLIIASIMAGLIYLVVIIAT